MCFLPLFQAFLEDYKIEFDLDFALSFSTLMQKVGSDLYDLQCLDSNLPAPHSHYLQKEWLQKQIQQHFALNLTLQDRLQDIEQECLQLNEQITRLQSLISNDPHYTRALFQAFKHSRTEKYVQMKRLMAYQQNQLKFEQNCGSIKINSSVKSQIFKTQVKIDAPATMEEFINEGYLVKALDLPEEYADSIL